MVSGRVVFAGGVESPGSGMWLSLCHCLSALELLGVEGQAHSGSNLNQQPGRRAAAVAWGMLSGVQVLSSSSFPLPARAPLALQIKFLCSISGGQGSGGDAWLLGTALSLQGLAVRFHQGDEPAARCPWSLFCRLWAWTAGIGQAGRGHISQGHLVLNRLHKAMSKGRSLETQ